VQVETGSEGSSPRTPHAGHGAAAPEENGSGGAQLELAPAQLSDWRLRSALASRQDFQVRALLQQAPLFTSLCAVTNLGKPACM
jgi:hypothetical protein